MYRNAWRVILGVVLVLLGAMALVQNFTGWRFEGEWWGVAFAIIFAAAGAGFLVTYFAQRQANWWAVIPGFTLIGLGILILFGVLNVKPDEILPAVFLGGIGASFLVIFFSERSRWWAMIPGGVLVSLAIMILFANDAGAWPAVIFFAGMAVTFGLVALTVRPGEPSRNWAWYPAAGTALLAGIVFATAGPLPGLVFPALLILAGLAMVGWTMFGRKA